MIQQRIHNCLLNLLKERKVPFEEVKNSFDQYVISASLSLNDTNNHILDYYFSYVSMHSTFEKSQINYQLYTELSGLVNKDNRSDLVWMISKINPFIPVGNFGVYEKLGTLYWKYNAVMSNKIEPHILSQSIYDTILLSQSVIIDFIDSFIDYLMNRSSASDCLQNNKWSNLLLGV